MDWCDRPPWRCAGAEGKGVPRVVSEQSRLASRGELGDNGPVDEDAREGPPRIEEAGEAARIRAQLGWVRTVGGGRRECVISSQGDVERAAVFLVALSADGRVGRIEGAT